MTTSATVHNLRSDPTLRKIPERSHEHGNAALIDRRTRWGNPYRIGPDISRHQAMDLHKNHLRTALRNGSITHEDLAGLASKNLFCCAPGECHGSVLARAADRARQYLNCLQAGRVPPP